MQNRVALLTTESEARTQLFRKPRFRDAVAVKFAIQEEVKRSVVTFDEFENDVSGLV